MGDTSFSEFTKITTPDDLRQRAWIEAGNQMYDISNQHWLVCIQPIVFAIWVEDIAMQVQIQSQEKTHVYFGGKPDPHANKMHDHEAEIILSVVDRFREANGVLFLMKLTDSGIRHTSLIKRRLIFFRYYKKDGLTYSRFKSYVSAYSFPRRIRIVSFRDHDYYNIFPMDLLGGIPGTNKWVFGLRHSNKALSRIIATGKIVVCEVPYQYKEKIYSLGNNHSVNPPAIDKLDLEVSQTLNFKFHIPIWADSYQEVIIRKSVNLGSHMLLCGESVSETKIRPASEHLFLVHFLHYLEQKNRGSEYMSV